MCCSAQVRTQYTGPLGLLNQMTQAFGIGIGIGLQDHSILQQDRSYMHVPKSSKLKLINNQPETRSTDSFSETVVLKAGMYVEGGERGKLSTFVTLTTLTPSCLGP